MGKKAKEFQSGDFIFAKVKGYPAWPARVQRLNGKKYFVYFYGTGETANLPPNMIFDFAENKDKFLTKSVKRRDFNEGVKQIEYDFANNVPLEQVIGVNPEAPPPELNDTADDSAINETMDTSTGDTTTADDTIADTTANTTLNKTQNDVPVEDSDEAAGALIIDEGKAKAKKAKPDPKTPATPKPKTPRARAKKDEAPKEQEAEEEEDKEKNEELVSRSGRKIRPKRYIDEQTEENTTLPSPAAKKKRVTPPPQEKEDKEPAKEKEKEKEKNVNYSAVNQSELEDLKEPFKPADPEKDNILIAYLPSGQYVGIKLFQSRPTSYKNNAARLKWDKQAATNAINLKLQLEKGQITATSISAQLVMDLNLTDEEKAALDKERETEEKKSRVMFLKAEMKLIELEVKIKTCLCLDKADTESCLKLLDELMELDMKPLMLLKHPTCVETVKRMRAYVGNTPSWELSEEDTLAFSKRAHHIRKRADDLYTNIKSLFTVPDGLAFWEFFSERVQQFKKVTNKLNADELLELVHEPIEMSQPTAHTTKAVIETIKENDVPPLEDDLQEEKKKHTPAKTKKPAASTPKQLPKRQSSRSKIDKEDKEKPKEVESEKEENQEEPKESEKESVEESNADVNNIEEKDKEEAKDKENGVEEEKTDNANDTEKLESSEKTPEKVAEVKNGKESKQNDKETEQDDEEKNQNVKETKQNEKETKQIDKETKQNDKETKQNDNDIKQSDKEPKQNDRETKQNVKETKHNDKETKQNDKETKQNDKETKQKDKDTKRNDKETKKNARESKQNDKEEEQEKKEKDVEEPRAKRSRGENKKTEAPPPKSPSKRKSKA